MKIVTVVLALMALTSLAPAQDLGGLEEVTAGNFFGLGARQMAMGGAGIASSLDGAALYYNPAALVRVHRIEFQIGLTHQKFSNETTQPGDRYNGYTSTINGGDISQTKTRFGTLNLTLPVPTYRGSLVVAFGVNRIMSFDRVALFHARDDSVGNIIDDNARDFETGGIYLYSAGAGIDISPNLSVGLALQVYSGTDDFKYDYTHRDDAFSLLTTTRNQVSEDYFGASAKAGILARPNSNVAVGLTVETPLDWQVKYAYDQQFDSANLTYEDAYQIEYDVQRPFIFGLGAAYRLGTFTVTGDAEYIDWSQLSYNDNPDMEALNDSLAMVYRDVVNLRAGAEYQIPSAGLSLRAGLFSSPLPYNKAYIKDDRSGYTLGFGWLVERILMLEGAYVHGSLHRVYTGPNGVTAEAHDTYKTFYFTLSYRY
jgi:hypothetical protein